MKFWKKKKIEKAKNGILKNQTNLLKLSIFFIYMVQVGNI